MDGEDDLVLRDPLSRGLQMRREERGLVDVVIAQQPVAALKLSSLAERIGEATGGDPLRAPEPRRERARFSARLPERRL